jgi:dolichol-phosphate mannosyltransferase
MLTDLERFGDLRALEVLERRRGALDLTVVVPTFNERDNIAPLLCKLSLALEGVAWEAIFVDDDSPDGTARLVKKLAAAGEPVRCIRRVGRRGLAGAVIEGALASAAPFVAVIDGDLQHDETLLPLMLACLRDRAQPLDLVIGSRYIATGVRVEGLGPIRAWGSRLAGRLAQKILRADITDPVSGFFMVRREIIEAAAPKLSTSGFKVLFDLIASSDRPLKVLELPYLFRPRDRGTSKLDLRVVADYLGLLIAKGSRDLFTPRALLFGAVGASGLVVHLTVLKALLGLGFAPAQFAGAATAMTSNYLLNNSLTFHDRRKSGLALVTGFVRFSLLCSVGLGANVAVATVIHGLTPAWWLAGAMGAGFGAVWNYATTSAAVW